MARLNRVSYFSTFSPSTASMSSASSITSGASVSTGASVTSGADINTAVRTYKFRSDPYIKKPLMAARAFIISRDRGSVRYVIHG